MDLLARGQAFAHSEEALQLGVLVSEMPGTLPQIDLNGQSRKRQSRQGWYAGEVHALALALALALATLIPLTGAIGAMALVVASLAVAAIASLLTVVVVMVAVVSSIPVSSLLICFALCGFVWRFAVQAPFGIFCGRANDAVGGV